MYISIHINMNISININKIFIGIYIYIDPSIAEFSFLRRMCTGFFQRNSGSLGPQNPQTRGLIRSWPTCDSILARFTSTNRTRRASWGPLGLEGSCFCWGWGGGVGGIWG